jgi:hypothetical protein
MKLPKKLTPEKHAELADRIERAENELFRVLTAVQFAYGVTDRAAKPLERMVTSMGGLIEIAKCRMDDHFYHDGHQGQSPYYGRPSNGKLGGRPRKSPTV